MALDVTDPNKPSELSEWQREFHEFLSSTSSADVQTRKDRIECAKQFLLANSGQPLVNRLNFLRFKDLSEDEIEHCFDSVGLHAELIRVIERNFKVEDFGTVDQLEEERRLLRLKCPFHVGDTVLKYSLSKGAYFPATVAVIDHDRHHDIIIADFLIPNCDEIAISPWVGMGFKGVIADVVPNSKNLSVNSMVVCIPPKSTDHIFYDCTISNVHGDGQVFDVCSAACENWLDIPITSIRTLNHPAQADLLDDAALRQADELDKSRKSRVVSALGFPSVGIRERGVTEAELDALIKGLPITKIPFDPIKDALTKDELNRLGWSIRSFLRYPMLDAADFPTRFFTYESFLQEARANSSSPRRTEGEIVDRSEPALCDGLLVVHPVQLERTSKGFGFDLSHFPRHPRCPYLFEYNPILNITNQCAQNNCMFVDPDFPPTYASLYGMTTPQTEEEWASEPKDSFDWKRISQIYPRSVVIVPGSITSRIATGGFSSRWLLQVMTLVGTGSEFEGSFSPSEQTCKYGVYSVRLFIDGRWYFVLVDDFIPIWRSSGRLAAAHSEVTSEIWPILVEKVYAKLMGSYAALQKPTFGWLPERAFEDLTGGLGHRDDYSLLNITKEEWFENMLGRNENKAFCTMLVGAPQSSTFAHEKKLNRMAIEVGSVHQVRHVVQLEDDRGGFWVGLLVSDYWTRLNLDPEIQESLLAQCAPRIRKELKSLQEGERSSMWLPFFEHLKLFSSCITCFGFPNWYRAAIPHSFRGRRRAGSRWQHDNDPWVFNPQFHLSMSEPGHLAAQFKLVDRRWCNVESIPERGLMMLSLLRAKAFDTPATDPADTIILSNSVNFNDVPSRESPAVYLHYTVDGGGYLLVPELGSDEFSEDFVLTIWATCSFTVRLCNDGETE